MYLVISTFGAFIVKNIYSASAILVLPIPLLFFTFTKFERGYCCGALPVLLRHYLIYFVDLVSFSPQSSVYLLDRCGEGVVQW